MIKEKIVKINDNQDYIKRLMNWVITGNKEGNFNFKEKKDVKTNLEK